MKLELEKEFKGDAYQARNARAKSPRSLAGGHPGAEKIQHAARRHGRRTSSTTTCAAAEWEQEDFDSKVTDYEVNRGFERA